MSYHRFQPWTDKSGKPEGEWWVAGPWEDDASTGAPLSGDTELLASFPEECEASAVRLCEIINDKDARIAELEAEKAKAETERGAALAKMTKYARRSGELEDENERLRGECDQYRECVQNKNATICRQQKEKEALNREIRAIRRELMEPSAESAARGKGVG